MSTMLLAPESSSPDCSAVLPASGNRPRLPHLDGVRGLAALWVVVHHCWITGQLNLEACHPLLDRLSKLIADGKMPVMIFLALSGFCLYYPLVSRNTASPAMPGSYFAFVRRRFRRIAPPYFAALFLCAALIWLLPAMRTAPPFSTWSYAIPMTWKPILTHLLLVHNLYPGHALRIDPPMWSLGLEWQLYLLFPFFVWLMGRFNAALVLTVAAAVALASRFGGPHLPGLIGYVVECGPLAYAVIFMCGMHAAKCYCSKRPPSHLMWLGTALAFGAALAVGAHSMKHEMLSGAGAYFLLLALADPSSRLRGWLGHRMLVQVGIFSYSLYLLHAPLQHILWIGTQRLSLSAGWSFAAILLVGTPIILGASYLFFLGLEKPFLKSPVTRRPRVQTVSESPLSSVVATSVVAIPA